METADFGGEISSRSSEDLEDAGHWSVEMVNEAGPSSKKTVLSFQSRRYIAKGNFVFISEILTSDRRSFALKRVDTKSRVAMHEVNIMLQLKHQNLVKIHYYYYKKHFDKNHVRVFIIMELVPGVLVGHIRRRHRKQQTFLHQEIALIMYQIFRGLEHMHRRGIAHRDVKSHNILIDTNEQIVKVCDFGSAKNLSSTKTINSTYVCSRWYRAPELLHQNCAYTTKIDIWSCGCVLAELILLYPLFRGSDSVDQWTCIEEVLGSPTADELAAMGLRPSVSECDVRRKDLTEVFGKGTPPVIINLFEQLVQYAHHARPTAWMALAHPAFNEIRSLRFRSSYPHLFNFTEEELSYQPDISQLTQAEVL